MLLDLKPIILRFGLVFFMCLSFTSWAQAETRTLRAVVQSDSPPTYFKDTKTGEAAGFAVDVLNEIAARKKFTVTYQFEKHWLDIAPLLMSDKADIAPGQGISDQKTEDADFTLPIATFKIVLFVRSDYPHLELKDGMTIGGTKGSAASSMLKKRYSSIKYVSYESNDNGLMALLSGNIDGFCTADSTLVSVARAAGLENRIRIMGPPLGETKRAIAVKKGNTELLALLDEGIAEFVNTPQYMKIYGKWYGGGTASYWSRRRLISFGGMLLLATVIVMAAWRYRSVRMFSDRLNIIFNSVSDAIMICETGTGRIVESNERSKAMFGDPGSLTLYELGQNVPPLSELAGGTSELLLLDHEGRGFFWCELSIKSAQIMGVERYIATVHDISERRQASEKIVASLKEKEILLQEIHHRVKNNMAVISSLLNLQSAYVRDEYDRMLLMESRGRIKAMALVHEKLYQSKDFTHIGLSGYVNSLVRNIRSAFITANSVTTDIVVEDINLDIDHLIPCGLIINELMTNSFKYAFDKPQGNEIAISISETAGAMVRFEISDNGKGLSTETFMDSGRMGLKLVKGLVEQLKGELEFISEAGTKFIITFPKNQRVLEEE